MAPLSDSESPCQVATKKTLLFVDVDGVLNVGISDPGNAPIEFSTANAERAAQMWAKKEQLSPAVRSSIDRLMSTCDRGAEGADETYQKLVSSPDCSLSDVLVARLAKLIVAAGEHCTVVLSSTWRLPKYVQRAKRLEEAVSRHLGRPFAFDARTQLFEDRSPGGRLQSCGEFAADFCRKFAGSFEQLRILMLEDFHIGPICSWTCGGQAMSCCKDVEDFLCSCVPASVNVSAKLVHTFDQWITESGLQVRIGCGLTSRHFAAALTFLNAGAEPLQEDKLKRRSADRSQVASGRSAWARVSRLLSRGELLTE